jgi:glutamate/tyrosine decarboxylase-like PLP-dependent enzyme
MPSRSRRVEGSPSNSPQLAMDECLKRASQIASEYLATLTERHVNAREIEASILKAFGGPLPEFPQDPVTVIDRLAAAADPGLVASAGPRYFGFVTGGTFPVAVAADWLVSAWDQNAALHVMSPALAAIEDAAAAWLVDLFGLPAHASVGFVTGAHMANVTALAAARHEVLRRAGWDVEARGLQGAPRVHVVAGMEAHASIGAACRMIGLGSVTLMRVAADDQGRMRRDDLARVLERCDGPTIVCAQVGNVNTGACDPMGSIADLTGACGSWLHVDGAFGLWAAAAGPLRHLVAGVERADSWTTDAHKWLNVPYDSGIVCVAHPAAHRAAMGQTAAYLIRAEGDARDGMDWTPEASRRGRAVPVYAALRTLGRSGIEDLVVRCCRLAARAADRLRGAPGVRVLNDVVLNQVLVRFDRAGANVTDAVIARIQHGGVCWAGGTGWKGERAMRLSVSGWRTSEEDIDRSVDAILRACREEAA